MFEALLIGAIVVGALACPVMMLLGRRGIGPGCAMMGCEHKEADDLSELRRREREIAIRIAELEAGERRTPVSASGGPVGSMSSFDASLTPHRGRRVGRSGWQEFRP